MAGIALAGLCTVAHGQGVVEAGSGYKDAVRAEMAASLDYRAPAVMPQATETVVTVVEYYNAAHKQHFVSADAAEIANLDGGAFGGAWVRTGQTFNAWALDGRPVDSVPVCRFFGTDQYRANGTRNLPRPHPIANGSITATATQFAIGEATGGKGPLSATQLDLLRNVYALAETDPMFPKAVTDFLETLSVVGPPA